MDFSIFFFKSLNSEHRQTSQYKTCPQDSFHIQSSLQAFLVFFILLAKLAPKKNNLIIKKKKKQLQDCLIYIFGKIRIFIVLKKHLL